MPSVRMFRGNRIYKRVVSSGLITDTSLKLGLVRSHPVADHSKRKYRNTLEFVESGFRACWENALDLNAASQKLHDGGFHATGLSLSVLALEELGN